MKKNYYTGEDTTLCGFDVLPYKYYFNVLSVLEGYQTMYLYDESPDRELHKLGTNDDSIYQRLNNYSKLIEEFYNKLPTDTLFIISADHGHIDIDELNLFEDKYLYKMLERNPSNDSRCLTFKVKDSYKKEFVSYFNSVYGKIYKLYDTK